MRTMNSQRNNNTRTGGRPGSNTREAVNNYGRGGSNPRNNQVPGKKKNNPLGRNRTIDYLDAKSLFRFINDQGKVLPRRITGVSAYQQRQVCQAVKYARHLALLPFVANDGK